MDLKNFNEKVLNFARRKAIREQRDIVVFKISDDYLKAQPVEYTKNIDDLDVVERFKVNQFSESEIEDLVVDINDFSSLKEGDRVIVNEQVQKIVKTTPLQFITEGGSKFLRSNGEGYGKENKKVTQKIEE